MKEQDNIFYVYAHYRTSGTKKDGIFYVGKGHGDRSTAKRNRNKYWHNIVNKYSYYVEILYDNLDEQTAFNLEVSTIARYGRKDLGLGPLVNLSDGGDGRSGCGKPVKNQFGDIFITGKEAAEWCRLVSGTHISNCCLGKIKSAGKHPLTGEPCYWKYIDDLTPFEKPSNSTYTPVKNQFGDVFPTGASAAAWCGQANSSSISACCLGKNATSGKHPITKKALQWKFKDDPTPFEEYFDPRREPVKNQFGDVFTTGDEAAAWCGLTSSTSIFACCKGKQKSAGKHPITKEKLVWSYSGS